MDPTDASIAIQNQGQASPAESPSIDSDPQSSSSFVAPLALPGNDDDPPSTSLPAYSPSGATPAYSYNPHADERRLAITTRGGRGHAFRTGVFRVANKRAGLALVLYNQDEGGVVIPSFGRNALVAGTVELASGEGVVRIEVELEGHLKLTIAEGGKKTRSLFKAEHTIWRKDGQHGAHQCPRTLNFVVPMPSSYSDSTGASRALPPSYQVIFPGVPGLFADSVYSLTVRVRRSRKVLWSQSVSISTPIKYYPRTRAPRAIMKHTLSFFSLLKIAPEEFCQVESTMQTRLGSGFAPIHCLLFIPSSCIYAMTDEIPFHLQLVAPLTSLIALCAPHALALSGGSRTSAIAQLQSSLHQSTSAIPLTSSLLLPSATYIPASANSGAQGESTGAGGGTTASILSGSTLSASLMHNLNTLSSTARGLIPGARHAHLRRPTIRVFILRQITVEVRGQKAWRTCVLGEGVLKPCPPGLDERGAGRRHAYNYPYPRPTAPLSPRPSFISRHRDSTTSTVDADAIAAADASASEADPLESLNWSGSVRVASPGSIQVGGFAAGALGLVVKDFLVLSLVPPDPARSPLIEHQHAQPIRLVTDPLVEDEGEGELELGAFAT